MELRWYQQEAVDAAYQYLMSKSGNPLICLPTGSGKSPTIAKIAQKAIVDYGGRVLVIAHRKELLEQNADKVRRMCPEIKVGIYSAGLRRYATEEPIVFCGIQSVYDKATLFDVRNLILIDECHLVPNDGEGMYRKFLEDFRQINPRLRVIGLTATPYRTGEGAICRQDGIFQEVCYDAPIRRLIDEGYLSKVTNRPPKTKFDTTGLHTRYGEFVAKEVEALFGGKESGEAVLETIEKMEGRNSIMVFCSSVRHAETVSQIIALTTGEEVGMVDGETSPLLRASVIARFANRSLRWLVSVDILTIGFDAPCVDGIAILRATMSPGLFAQIVGRGLRTYPGKEDCLVLDFGGNIDRHGPIDAIDFGKNRIKRGGERLPPDDPGKECVNCGLIVPTRKLVCECGFRFGERKPNHESEADTTTQIISEPELLYVEEARAAIHEKPNKTPSLRMDYKVVRDEGDDVTLIISEWICLLHDGFAKKKAVDWWRKRSKQPTPETIEEAVRIFDRGGLAIPKTITARQEGKYWRIVDAEIEEIPEIGPDVYEEEEMPF